MGKPRTIAPASYADANPTRVHVFRNVNGRWRVFRGHRAVDTHRDGSRLGYRTQAEAMRRADREARG